MSGGITVNVSGGNARPQTVPTPGENRETDIGELEGMVISKLVCFVPAAALGPYVHACVRAHVPQGRRLTDSFLVCGPSRRELQGRAAEGRAGDLSLRIELISLHPPPPNIAQPLPCCPTLKVTIIFLCLHQL